MSAANKRSTPSNQARFRPTRSIYLDYAASEPAHKRTAGIMSAALVDHFANPSSVHDAGARARYHVERARASLAEYLGCDADELIFTSGGTESNNLALRGIVEALPKAGRHVVASSIEHPGVLEVLRHLQAVGSVSLTLVDPDRSGRVSRARMLKAITPRTGLLTLMLVNNETGAIQPVADVARAARRRGVLVHCDAVQAVGKMPLHFGRLGVHTASFSAHKFGGPKGVGGLYAAKGVAIAPVMFGGGQERGLRPGTLNTPGICAMTEALVSRHSAREMSRQYTRLEALRKHLLDGLVRHLPGAIINAPREASGRAREGASAAFLPGFVNVAFPGHEGMELVRRLSDYGIAVSAGAACASGKTPTQPDSTDGSRRSDLSARSSIAPSHVLLAMGLGEARARASLRISMGRETTRRDIDRLLKALRTVAR